MKGRGEGRESSLLFSCSRGVPFDFKVKVESVSVCAQLRIREVLRCHWQFTGKDIFLMSGAHQVQYMYCRRPDPDGGRGRGRDGTSKAPKMRNERQNVLKYCPITITVDGPLRPTPPRYRTLRSEFGPSKSNQSRHQPSHDCQRFPSPSDVFHLPSHPCLHTHAVYIVQRMMLYCIVTTLAKMSAAWALNVLEPNYAVVKWSEWPPLLRRGGVDRPKSFRGISATVTVLQSWSSLWADPYRFTFASQVVAGAGAGKKFLFSFILRSSSPPA